MARYIDGFLLAVPKRKLAAYKAMATTAGKVFKEYGALEFVESVIDDVPDGFGVPFPKSAKAKPGEVVVFSWVAYKSKAHRNAVNRKVMADPRLQTAARSMPFDPRRMSWGGFKVLVDL